VKNSAICSLSALVNSTVGSTSSAKTIFPLGQYIRKLAPKIRRQNTVNFLRLLIMSQDNPNSSDKHTDASDRVNMKKIVEKEAKIYTPSLR